MNTLKLILGIIAAVLCFQKSSFSQEVPEKDIESEVGVVYTIVEQMPEYKDGNDAMHSYIAANLKYPEAALKKGEEGVVYLTFVVEKNGALSNIKILRGVSKELDEEAIRVVKTMNKDWSPGIQRGEKVRVIYNLPVRFVIKGSEDKK